MVCSVHRPGSFYLKTYGCQMNVYDSERIEEILLLNSWVKVDRPHEAELVILNTCHIRDKADEKVYSEIGRLRKISDFRLRIGGNSLLIGLVGCVAQAEGYEVVRRAPNVNFVVGPQSYHLLPEVLKRAREDRCQVKTDFPVERKFEILPKRSARSLAIARGPTAFVTVQEGCDKFCAFCVVPYTRGSEESRTVCSIVEEVEMLVESNVKEITLLGQNVNAYRGIGPDGNYWCLAKLLEKLSHIEGLARLRYTTSHPRDMNDDLIKAHHDLPKLMPYLHLPVQSGSDRILKSMNRQHTRDDYLRLVEKLFAACPEIALSGDFIVGFPGETESDFVKTLDIVKDAGYASAFSFKYSERPGTVAASLNDQVCEIVKSERLCRLQKVITERTCAFCKSKIGKTVDVLLERKGRDAGQLTGRSPWAQLVHVDIKNVNMEKVLGKLVSVRIESANSGSLFGTIVSPH